jgi:cadmium resistance protein CadD (predicted permease)
MSEEGSFGITVAEKFFGFLLVLVGALLTYYTLTSVDALGAYTGFFGFLSLIPLLLGIILLLAKTE